MKNIKTLIREELGHGEGSRKVRISRDGVVTYYGSRSDTDRNHDYWHDAGTVSEWAKKLGLDQ